MNDLGQTAWVAQQGVFAAIIYLGAILLVVGLAIAAIAAIAAIRRRLRTQDNDAATTLTLSDVRRMRDEGWLTPDEFDRLRRVILDTAGGGCGGKSAP